MKKLINTIIMLTLCLSAIGQQVDTDYENQKKHAIKMEFFSPLTGNTTVGYESYIKEWISWEVKLGAIGIGTDNDNTNPAGFFFKGGPKLKLNPDFVTGDLRSSHLLSGKYIRPEIIFAQYSEDVETVDGNDIVIERESFTSASFLITYGRQYVLANIMTLDYHIGLGYGFDSSNNGKYNFSHSNGDSSFPVAISVGFTVGVLLK